MFSLFTIAACLQVQYDHFSYQLYWFLSMWLIDCFSDRISAPEQHRAQVGLSWCRVPSYIASCFIYTCRTNFLYYILIRFCNLSIALFLIVYLLHEGRRPFIIIANEISFIYFLQVSIFASCFCRDMKPENLLYKSKVSSYDIMRSGMRGWEIIHVYALIFLHFFSLPTCLDTSLS
jgi:hypothetical protein